MMDPSQMFSEAKEKAKAQASRPRGRTDIDQ